MMCRRLLTSVAMLSCLIALLFSISTPALCQDNCGSNPLGDTSGDTDFYVSKNQGTPSSAAVSQPAKEAVALGSTASKANQSGLIQSLTASPGGPQPPGKAITWTAAATAAGGEQLLYDFWLKGPSTNGQLMEKTGWIGENTWTWNTTEADAGENQVELRVKYASSGDFDDRRTESYAIASATAPAEQKNAATAATAPASAAADSHPVSRTADSMKNKPRLAPDERPRVVPTNPSGPNMSMPDPNPKPPAGTGSAETGVSVVETVEASPEPEEPKVMDMGGKWSVKLQDMAGSLDLILIQAGETLMGSGTLNDQGAKIPVTAKGAVSGNSVTLNVATVVGEYVNQIDKRFTLELVKVDRSVSGAYVAYSGEDLTGKGNATASGFGA